MKEMVGGCCVCSDETGTPENPLVYCDGEGCTVAVHQACYGIVSVPAGSWYCKRCESQERAARVVSPLLDPRSPCAVADPLAPSGHRRSAAACVPRETEP